MSEIAAEVTKWDVYELVAKYGKNVRDWEGMSDPVEAVNKVEEMGCIAALILEGEPDEVKSAVLDFVTNLVREYMDNDVEVNVEMLEVMVYAVKEVLTCRYWLRTSGTWQVDEGSVAWHKAQ